ncbi:peptidase S8/S53 domain-containing protein [Absidia repens]|uniref:Peptidase S8/S53 domain-containing protein n=1 Tax=Absidia repens TaxID=90262 RepID=A0A1X2IJ03_9FUNG|nr:peptidase S8/S53 domain-containing protein [Absidia repens]
MKFTILTGAVLLAGFAVVSAAPYPTSNIAPLYIPADTESVQDSFIVVLKNHLNERHLENHAAWITELVSQSQPYPHASWLDPSHSAHGINHIYDSASLKGYAGKFSPNVIDQIRSSDDVLYVEQDSIVYANELQRNAPWGLARISHRESLKFGTFSKYNYDAKTAGEGVKVYVIDTGINIDHVDLEGRASWGSTIPEGDPDEDGNGHGSHCAGTIAGKTYGVAKKAEPVAVKVLRSNGSGSMSDVVQGVEWAALAHTKAAEDAKKAGKPFKGSVANMSLGGGKSRSLDLAVNGAVDIGLVFAVAAGNDNADACGYSPASAEKAITVGASTLTDERASFSNYGKCVDVFAPGVNIESIWKGSKYATNVISGTSMASPHVAGLAAYVLSQEKEGASPKEIKAKILALATKGALTDVKGSPNLLINNGYDDDNKKKIFKSIFHDTFGAAAYGGLD